MKRQSILRMLPVDVQSRFLPSGRVNDRTHLLGHVIATALLAVVALVACWLWLFNGAW